LFFFKSVLSINLYIATSFSFVVANIISIILNKKITFRDRSNWVLSQYSKFLFTSITAFLLTLALMWLFYSKLNLFIFFGEKRYLLSKLLTSFFVILWNFLINKFWIFRQIDMQLLFDKAKQHYHDSCFISIIIPAYNEEKRITHTLLDVISKMEKKKYKWEIIVVDDGSTDKTSEVARKILDNDMRCKVITNVQNRGKGFAVKTGVINSSGEYFVFLDADNSTKIDELNYFEQYFDENTVLIGSRYLHSNHSIIKQSKFRIAISRIGNFLIRIILLIDIKDSQCGFKVFHKNCKSLFQIQKIFRFGFDFEILALVSQLNLKIKELPVSWTNSADSRVRPIKDSIHTAIDLLRVKYYFLSKNYEYDLKKIIKE